MASSCEFGRFWDRYVAGYQKGPMMEILLEEKHTTSFAALVEFADTSKSTIVSNLSKPLTTGCVKEELEFNFIASHSMG